MRFDEDIGSKLARQFISMRGPKPEDAGSAGGKREVVRGLRRDSSFFGRLTGTAVGAPRCPSKNHKKLFADKPQMKSTRCSAV